MISGENLEFLHGIYVQDYDNARDVQSPFNATTLGDEYDYDIEESLNSFFWDELVPTCIVYSLTFLKSLRTLFSLIIYKPIVFLRVEINGGFHVERYSDSDRVVDVGVRIPNSRNVSEDAELFGTLDSKARFSTPILAGSKESTSFADPHGSHPLRKLQIAFH
ncbi:UNVERIFIED_CONTAM: hypothetical protein PYX00_002677 [Menopon gallinae]|uniref:Uncharacterized protein n=1 Tax=Menopon gallinae TaxID=328185 RepID=A0AAW2HY35_9NEOP